jgi:subfamily B ATP-binding cassette protein MsbA
VTQKTNNSNADQSSGLSVYIRLLQYAKQYWVHVVISIIGFTLVSASGAAFIYLLAPLIDQAFVTDDTSTVVWIPIAIAALFFIRSIGSYLGLFYIGSVGQLVVKELRRQMYDTILYSPTTFYDSKSTGTILSKFSFDVERVTWASAKSVPILIRDSQAVLFSLILMFYYSWKLTLILMIAAPIVVGLVNYATRKFRRLSKKLQLSVGDITSRVEEAIGGHTIVKLFTAEQYEKNIFEKLNEKNRRNQTRIVAAKAINTPLVQLILGFTFAFVIYVAFTPSVRGDLTPGKFSSFVGAVMMLLSSAKKLTMINEILQSGIAASMSVFGLIDQARQKDQGTQEMAVCHGEVTFKNVTFTYSEENAEKALNGISLHAHQGQMIALVGKSGSGKSTLVKLLPRFYDVQSGDIQIDGHSIKDLKINHLRKHIAMVSQDIILFNDTIEKNISYAMPDKTKEEIRDAARRAHALDFIEKFPEGFNTMVGDRGVLLSGGQRQRIAIARALLKDAAILIFDEATSSLDSESEFHIQEALKEACKNRTTFVIAHRLSTIESADHILVMDNGSIVEQGTHTELIAKQGLYAQLYQRQFKTAPSSSMENA